MDFNEPPEKWEENKKPWWNDGEKVAGMAATVVLLAVVALIAAGVVKLITLMF